MTTFAETDLIGKWRVRGDLGQGDFGAVYRVEAEGEVGALKTATSTNSAAATRLSVERATLTRLQHQGIPSILDEGTVGGIEYFVMTLASGTTLLRRIDQWNKLGRVHGAGEATAISAQLLEILSYIHAEGVVHRDIKDANVLVEGTDVTLIDFGFSKRAGDSEIRDADSFWRAGAARFSPVTKLDSPGLALPQHDVYAVGVLLYRMLTGRFPWSVTAADDVGALKDAIRDPSRPLVPPSEVSSLISLDVSRFCLSLLNQNDYERPTAARALETARQLAETSGGLLSAARSHLPQEHVIRDQVHGDVRLSQFEYDVLGTAEMQRLRWIKQLGLTNLVYPGAEHSRYSHSVGTLDCVERMFSAMEATTGLPVDRDTRQVARLYALVHDVPHIASGHTLEDELGFFVRHDRNQARFERLVERKTSQIGKLLRSTDIGRAVLSLLDPAQNAEESGIAAQAVSGVVGADVLDYIDRDSLNCGLDHRVDSALYRQVRFYNRDSPETSLMYSSSGGKYGIRVDREFAVESLLLDRYALFLKVYTHSSKLAADALLGKALSFRKNAIREPDFEWVGDEGLIRWLQGSRASYATELGDRLRARVLPVGVYRARVLSDQQLTDAAYNDHASRIASRLTPDGRTQFERDIARRSGVPFEQIFSYLPASAPGYRRANLWSSESEGMKPQSDRLQADFAIGQKHLALWECWVFTSAGDPSAQQRVANIAEEEFHRPNLITRYGAMLSGLV